ERERAPPRAAVTARFIGKSMPSPPSATSNEPDLIEGGLSIRRFRQHHGGRAAAPPSLTFMVPALSYLIVHRAGADAALELVDGRDRERIAPIATIAAGEERVGSVAAAGTPGLNPHQRVLRDSGGGRHLRQINVVRRRREILLGLARCGECHCLQDRGN